LTTEQKFGSFIERSGGESEMRAYAGPGGAAYARDL